MIKYSQSLRIAVRALILLAMIALPFLVHYRIAVEKHLIPQIRSEGAANTAEHILIAFDNTLGEAKADTYDYSDRQVREEAAGDINQLRGNIWSFSYKGKTWTDLLAGLDSIFASKSVISSMLAGMILPLAITLIFGRAFCSWLCPAGLLFDMGNALRRLIPWKRELLQSHKLWYGNKYILLAVGLITSAIVAIPLLHWLYPPALLGREIHYVIDSFFEGVAVDPYYTGVAALSGISLFFFIILLIEIFAVPRMWCRYLCPGGALYGLLGSRRAIRIENNLSKCTQCSQCIRACPMGLNPMRDPIGIECDNCLACMNACNDKALHFRLGFAPRRKP